MNIPLNSILNIMAASEMSMDTDESLLVPRTETQSQSADDEGIGYTFCDACNGVPMCGIEYLTKGDVITQIGNWPDFPTSALCSKAYGTLQRQYHPNRLKYPMKRTTAKGSKDPGYVRITWDEAYAMIAKELKRIKKEHGPHAAFFYVGDPKEPRAAVQRLANLYGSVNYGTESSTGCRMGALIAERLAYGYDVGSPATKETKSMLIWGTNPCYSSTQSDWKGLLAAKKRGTKFIVVDPRVTPTATILADIHLQPKPNTMAALASGMMHVIFKENLHDQEFCQNWIHGIDELKTYVQQFTPEKAAEIAQVPAQQIIDAARMYATNAPGGVKLSAQGTTHNTNAANNHRSILMLPAICGYLDIPGGIVKPSNPLEGMGGPHWGGDLPPEFTLRDKTIANAANRLDNERTPAWAEMLLPVQTSYLPEWIEEGKVKAFLGWGFNMMIWAQTKVYQQAFDKLDFAMAVDYFYRPWTHDHLDLILPAATNYERLAPFAVQGRTLFGRTTVPTVGEAREDWKIALDIGCHLGFEKECYNGDVELACNDILKMWDTSYEKLMEKQIEGIKVAPLNANSFKKYETGIMRQDKKIGFPTPTGKVEAISTVLQKHGNIALPEYREGLKTSAEYPLIMVSGSRLPYITHSKWREDSPWLHELQREPLLMIHPDDAEARGITKGDEISVSSAWGVITVKAKPTIMMVKGSVGMMHGWAKANVNELVPREFDPISGYAPYKEVPCQVRKV
jgi:anaerobic selenocysteine-containing dehydrogenase